MSGNKSYLLQELCERGIEALKRWGAAACAGCRKRRGGSKSTRVDSYIEDGQTGAPFGDAIPMTVRHAFDEAVEPQSTQVVRHVAGRIVIGVAAQ